MMTKGHRKPKYLSTVYRGHDIQGHGLKTDSLAMNRGQSIAPELT